MLLSFDVIVIGAGAAGMMCAIEAGKRGRRVLILEKSNKPGKKILMSGGGHCNFTNQYASALQYVSQNPHFCKSALSRFTANDFIQRVQSHRIAYYEKTLGQLFCVEKSSQIVSLLLSECAENHVEIQLNQTITDVKKTAGGFLVLSNHIQYFTQSLVVATGGLSIPTLGSSPFGYQLAEQFGLLVQPTRAGLVPLTLHLEDKTRFQTLSGIAVDCRIQCRGQSFRENMLFTHRGLSGPAILQISSYWRPGDALEICFLPDIDLHQVLQNAQASQPDTLLRTLLSHYFAKRLLSVFLSLDLLNSRLKQCSHRTLQDVAMTFQAWAIKPNATEGYRTAEVTLGGVDCDALSSKTFEAKQVKNLYFIGEVIDVTGWLGGYNFQWAWASGWAAGQVV